VTPAFCQRRHMRLGARATETDYRTFGSQEGLGTPPYMTGSLAAAVSHITNAFTRASPDGPSLWIARSLQGIGAAFVVTGALALVAVVFANALVRARAFALMAVVSGVGMAVGPTLGGGVTAWVGWRWIFFANVPFCLFVAFLLPRLVPESHADEKRPLDLVGVAFLTAALALLIDATLRTRTDVSIAMLLVGVAVAILVLFWLQQRRRAVPLLDPAVFATLPMIGVALLLIAVSDSYWAILVTLPPALQNAFGWNDGQIGLASLAATAPMLVVPLVGGSLVIRIGRRNYFTLSLAIFAAGNLLILSAVLLIGTPLALPLMLAGMVVIGTGAALAHPQLSGAVLALTPPDRAGMASAVTIVARQGGFAIGVAALAVIGAGAVTPAVFAVTAATAVIGAIAAMALLPRGR
jgi:MFS family permease